MTSLLALLLVLVAGLPLGFAMTRTLPLALVLAPIAGAATATVSVLLMLAFRGPLLLWFIPVYLLTGFLAWRLRSHPPARFGSWRDAALLTLPLVPPLLQLAQSPINWDTHLIWWLHAGYFSEGGEFSRASIGNPALIWSHTDYPPLASAPVALAWHVLDVRTFYPAALVTGALTWSAIAMLVYAVRLVTAGAPALTSWLAALLVGYAAWSPFWIVPTSGFSDAMCATSFAAAAVLLLFHPEPLDRRLLPLALLLASAAALMKNEGVSMVLALAIVSTIKFRRHGLRRVAWLWLPIAVAGVWSITSRLLGARTDVLAGGRFTALLHGDRDTVGRFPLIMSTMAGRIGWIMLLTALAAVLGNLLLRSRRARLGLGADGWLWAVLGLHWAGLTLIYLVTPYNIRWHLGTSIDRVLIALVVLACASAACWLTTALLPAPLPATPTEPATESVPADPAATGAPPAERSLPSR